MAAEIEVTYLPNGEITLTPSQHLAILKSLVGNSAKSIDLWADREEEARRQKEKAIQERDDNMALIRAYQFRGVSA